MRLGRDTTQCFAVTVALVLLSIELGVVTDQLIYKGQHWPFMFEYSEPTNASPTLPGWAH